MIFDYDSGFPYQNAFSSRLLKACPEFRRCSSGPRQIADYANRRGWRTRKTVSARTGQARGGNRWTPRQVLATLTNPTYAGRLRIGNKTGPSLHEPVVSQEVFNQVAEQIAGRRGRLRPRGKQGAHWPLAGRLFCAACGRAMSPSTSRYGNRVYRYYRCRSHAGGRPPCPGVSVSVYHMERAVRDMLGDEECIDAENEQVHRAFIQAWKRFSDWDQSHLLPRILKRVEYDFKSEMLKIDLAEDASDVVRLAGSPRPPST